MYKLCARQRLVLHVTRPLAKAGHLLCMQYKRLHTNGLRMQFASS